VVIFSLWLYSPILGLDRLHETFCLISVTNLGQSAGLLGRVIQLVARPLLTAPDDCNDGEVGGTKRFFGGGNRSTRRKRAPTPLCPPQISLARLEPPRWEASD
jgi:hypothetical protein